MALRISHNILPRRGGKHPDDSGYEEKTPQKDHHRRLPHSFGDSRHFGVSLEDTSRIFRSSRRGHIQRYKQVGVSLVKHSLIMINKIINVFFLKMDLQNRKVPLLYVQRHCHLDIGPVHNR